MRSSWMRRITDGVSNTEVRHERGAGEQRRHQARLQARGVEQRVREQVAVAVAQPDGLGPARVRPHARAVAQHRALGRAGGARGEDDVGHRVAGQRRFTRRDLGRVGLVGPGQEVGPRRGAVTGRAVEQHDLLDQVARARVVEERDVVGVEEVADGEQEARARRAQHVCRLLAEEAGAHRHEHPAGGVEAERGEDPLMDVRRPHRRAVARLEPTGDERARNLVDLRLELGEREADVAVDDRFVVRPERGAAVDDGGNRVGQLVAGGAHGRVSLVVAAVPSQSRVTSSVWAPRAGPVWWIRPGVARSVGLR